MDGCICDLIQLSKKWRKIYYTRLWEALTFTHVFVTIVMYSKSITTHLKTTNRAVKMIKS